MHLRKKYQRAWSVPVARLAAHCCGVVSQRQSHQLSLSISIILSYPILRILTARLAPSCLRIFDFLRTPFFNAVFIVNAVSFSNFVTAGK